MDVLQQMWEQMVQTHNWWTLGVPACVFLPCLLLWPAHTKERRARSRRTR